MVTREALIRGHYAALERGDIDAALSVLDPGVRWSRPAGPDAHGPGTILTGHDEVRAALERGRSLFGEDRFEPREFVGSDDRIVVLGVRRLRGARGGGAEAPSAHYWHFAGDRAIRVDDVHDSAPVRELFARDRGDHVWPLGIAYMKSRTLYSAVELGVFTALANGPVQGEELRQRLGLDPRGARDFFDALVALGLLERGEDGYANTVATSTLLADPESDTYIGGLMEYTATQWYWSWGRLTDTLRSGRSHTYGDTDPFEAIYGDPDLAERFRRAMAGGAVRAVMALPDAFPWKRYRTVADIGCSDGPVLARLLRTHPHLTGVGFDLPPVEAAFQRTVERHGLGDRMSFAAGDFRTGGLPRVDALIFGHVLLDWDVETRRMLLAKAYEALPDGGAVLIYDMMIDEERTDLAGLLFKLHMLIDYPGGGTYTARECFDWLAEAGFRDLRSQSLAGPDRLVIAIK
ncbi:Ketosteroid isomerase-related protein [Marinactinospora thermotolerans DSM 45154]|uniref:Ketosteroid isomerase-related protein n=2 Tax=Marinactinospora thermotolerans TaxID=531310 RepID=A0A1T4LVY8_9ACTN|nr:methyltransferase [Marinactinospora thermotolerans]ARB18031.1 methyltransferase [Marinactinospora thermotolerans]SJZ58842.1 Ketosteroid isomerase-related protein [Marinactinospora thermotolerans DSM 45154]